MREIRTSGLMSGERKRSDAHRAQATAPLLDSTEVMNFQIYASPRDGVVGFATVFPGRSVSMEFEPSLIGQGGVSRLTCGLNNGALIPATVVALSDRLPDGVMVAAAPNEEHNCGGTLTAAAGGRDVSYSGGSLAADATCTIAVDVTSAAIGSYLNDTESVTSSLGTSMAASATLTVDAADAPGFARVFAPDTIRQGGETEIVFMVDNGANGHRDDGDGV